MERRLSRSLKGLRAVTDSASRHESFDVAWAPYGRVVAVASAALIALLGVLAHAPVWLACLRGAGTLVLVLVLVRCAGFLAAAARDARASIESAPTKEQEDERSNVRRKS